MWDRNPDNGQSHKIDFFDKYGFCGDFFTSMLFVAIDRLFANTAVLTSVQSELLTCRAGPHPGEEDEVDVHDRDSAALEARLHQML